MNLLIAGTMIIIDFVGKFDLHIWYYQNLSKLLVHTLKIIIRKSWQQLFYLVVLFCTLLNLLMREVKIQDLFILKYGGGNS